MAYLCAMEISFENFYHGTKCKFKACKKPLRKPNYISYSTIFEDRISSLYWYGTDKNGDYVIRCSNHWFEVANNYWASIGHIRTFKENSGKVYLKNMRFI